MEGSRSTCAPRRASSSCELPLPGLYNVYNALAALAAGAASSGSRRSGSPPRWATMRAAFGRVETIDVGGDAGLDPADQEPGRRQRGPAHPAARGRRRSGLDLWIALNDRIADGRDVSWIWDADFELLAGRVRRVVCAGTRAPEMALRLKYAGWPTERIEVVPEIEALARPRASPPPPGRLFALPTYTALLELRKLLADRGLAKEFWR